MRPHSPPACSQPCFAAAQFFLLMAARMNPSGQAPSLSRTLVPPNPQPLGHGRKQNQHRRDHLGVKLWPLNPHPSCLPHPSLGSDFQFPLRHAAGTS